MQILFLHLSPQVCRLIVILAIDSFPVLVMGSAGSQRPELDVNPFTVPEATLKYVGLPGPMLL